MEKLTIVLDAVVMAKQTEVLFVSISRGQIDRSRQRERRAEKATISWNKEWEGEKEKYGTFSSTSSQRPTGLFSYSLEQHPSLLLWLSCSSCVTATYKHAYTSSHAWEKERTRERERVCTHLTVFRTKPTARTTTTTPNFNEHWCILAGIEWSPRFVFFSLVHFQRFFLVSSLCAPSWTSRVISGERREKELVQRCLVRVRF